MANYTDKIKPIFYIDNNYIFFIFRYADEYFRVKPMASLPKHSRFRKWVPTCAAEMQKFIGMIFAMGLVVQLSVTEYWTVDDVTSTPFFGRCMSRDRFMLLLSFWHLADNATQGARGTDAYQPLHKLGKLT